MLKAELKKNFSDTSTNQMFFFDKKQNHVATNYVTNFIAFLLDPERY